MTPSSHADLEQALDYVDPARCSYEEWVEVGMALHDSGLPMEAWDAWSRGDSGRYHEGECARKWRGFGNNSGDAVRSGTLARMAMERGWSASGSDEALDWDSPIFISDAAWADEEVPEGTGQTPTQMLSDYIAALFDDADHVCYVCQSWETPDGRKVPTKGHSDRTAGELRQELAKTSDLGAVLGDYDPAVGAWIRFNPLDGKGVGNANVTEYRYALVESDTLPYERQLGTIRAMNLPCAAVVTSGGKSVHAVVRVDAGTDFDLYRRRVDELYAYCRKSGFEPDTQNKNPSRLSRLPGATRGGRLQELVSTSSGPASWSEWEEWRDAEQDDLPEIETFASTLDDMPDLAPVLIGTEEHGILRQGHKGMLVGPSKAGKSFLLVELGCAIANGTPWLGYECRRGRVLYVNLEIDSASFAHRLADIAERKAYGREWAERFDVFNLRGHAAPLDRLAPKIIRRCLKAGGGQSGHYSMIIIDPLYKIITGDENSASDMAEFTSLFDRIAHETGASTMACHHHSKGTQGQKRSMDRASGSGVFARDPDALLDVSPLEIPEKRRHELDGATAWRMEATLREFKSPDPLDLLFVYPTHVLAGSEAARWQVEGEDPFAKGREAKKEKDRQRRQEYRGLLEDAIDRCVDEGIEKVYLADLMDHMGAMEETGAKPNKRTVQSWASSEWSPIGCKKEIGKRISKKTGEVEEYDTKHNIFFKIDGDEALDWD